MWLAWVVVAWSAGPLDINSATLEQLDALPGLGPIKARAVLAWRAEQGPCATLEDLLDVPGIGAATLAAIRDRVTCAAGAPPPAAPPVPRDDAPAPVATTLRVDVNTATPEALVQLPGIVSARARAIVDDRERNGPFASCDELVRVAGIGPATVATFGDRCVAE